MNILSNQLNKTAIVTNILDMDYDLFLELLDLSLDLSLGEL